ncbi:MAG: glycosyltransferase family 4 protein [Proteobacteria bacterium]|nr:glycosyltransferase family 4 protein [Pseudomonadota bacterium]
MKKKILIVSHRWPPRYGGLQNSAFMYAERLARFFDVGVFTSLEKGYKNIIPRKVSLIEGKSFNFLYKYLGIPQPIFTFNAIKKLKDAVKNNDVILINDRYYISSFFAYKFAKRYNKKIILWIHTPILDYKFPFSLFYKLNNFLTRNVVYNSDKIYAVSNMTGEVISKYFKINKNFEVLYSPTKLDEIRKVKEIKRKIFTVLFVGRFVSKKGVILLPEIAKRLQKEKINLIAIGDGPEFQKVKMESINISNLQLLGKIVDRIKLIRYYKSSHLFLIPSKHGEAFPLVIGDALACGLPIVSTKGGTYIEIFDKDVGYLCDTYSPDEIAEKIIKIKNDKEKYKFFSKNAINFAKENLDLNKNIIRLKLLIDDIT